MTITTTRPAGPAKDLVARQDPCDATARIRSRRWTRRFPSMGVVAVLACTSSFLSPAFGETLSPLRVEGRHFVDAAGRVVILRGVNLTGDAKVPPFFPGAGPRDLDRVAALGIREVRPRPALRGHGRCHPGASSGRDPVRGGSRHHQLWPADEPPATVLRRVRLRSPLLQAPGVRVQRMAGHALSHRSSLRPDGRTGRGLGLPLVPR